MPKQNVIFLDIDGVVCTALSTRISALLHLPLERQMFDPIALFWLRWLVCRTQAMIVLCSSWRGALYADDPLSRAFIGNLYCCLAKNRTPITDVAPQIFDGDKGLEIRTWLLDHPRMQYAVLDDHDHFMLAPEVYPHWIAIPPNRGLRRREARAARKLFRTL